MLNYCANACIQTGAPMRHIFTSTAESAEGTSRVFTRTKRNFSAETLANRAAKKDQKYVLESVYLLTLSLLATFFVDDVDEEEVESDEVVDGQF
jgi:hypothetical protein